MTIAMRPGASSVGTAAPGLGGPGGPEGSTGDLARLTVTAAGHRRDLVLPGRVPVAELVPDLVALLGVPVADGQAGWSLVRTDARRIRPDAGLLAQGVRDGEVLSLVATAELEALTGGGWARQHDDVAEAVADVVAGLGARWGARETAAVPGWAAGTSALVLLGGVTTQLARRPQDPWMAGTAAGVVVVLVVLAAALARVRSDTRTAIAVTLTATPYAATAAAAVVPGERLGWPLVSAGCAVVGVGWIGRVALGRTHWLLPVPAVAGLAAVVLGAAHALGHVDVAAVAAGLVVALVVGARFVPWLGLAVAGSTLVLPGPPGRAVSETRVRASVGRVRDLVLGVRVGVAAVVVLGAPLVVGSGAAGLGVLGAAAGAMLLGARRFVLRREVLSGVVGGGLALVAALVAALVLHPSWAPVLTAVAAGSLVLALAAVLVSPRSGARLEQVLDLLEGLCLGSLLPLLVVASGLAASVRAAVG